MPSSICSTSTRRAQAKRIDVERVTLTPEQEAGMPERCPTEADYVRTVYPGTEIWVDGKLAAGFYRLEEDASPLLQAAKKIPYIRDFRTGGMRTRSCIFGYRPREPLRKDFCGCSTMATKYPRGFSTLLEWSLIAERYYREASPLVYAEHSRWARKEIKDEWRMGASIFTSGIANKDTSHFYHKDRGNRAGTWNSMIVLSRDIRGGETVVPELGTAFAYDDLPCVLTFPAESHWHGVRKLTTHGVRGYRYSFVFYTLASMTQCGTRKEELSRIRKVRSEREHRRGDVDATVAKIYESGPKEAKEVIDRMREEGRIEELKTADLTLEQRVARLEKATSAQSKQVLRRLKRRLAEQQEKEK